jgi:hypothetical protein
MLPQLMAVWRAAGDGFARYIPHYTRKLHFAIGSKLSFHWLMYRDLGKEESDCRLHLRGPLLGCRLSFENLLSSITLMTFSVWYSRTLSRQFKFSVSFHELPSRTYGLHSRTGRSSRPISTIVAIHH